ncbi:MAG: F0F1 ATP synthase subunit epsilon [Candidatus Levybacteria bacterium]|nr:F0F1 ATP synthase subunit epsilon [Candidatus Levybacteria bacterium]
MKLQLEIVTPLKVVFKEDVDEIVAPTINGEITILPNHVGLFTKIQPGELVIKKGSSLTSLAITGGFIEINNNKVTILADYAVRSEDIEIEKANEARKRAETLLKEKLEEKDFAKVEGELRRALLELKVAHKRKARPIPETSP